MSESHFRLRMPTALHEKLVEESEKNHRSINAEIISRLTFSFEKKEFNISVIAEEVDHVHITTSFLTQKFFEMERDIKQLKQAVEELTAAKKP